MLMNKQFSQAKSNNQNEDIPKGNQSQQLDESDLDFYNNVVQNLTPRVSSTKTLDMYGKRMSEDLQSNKHIQNCILLQNNQRRKRNKQSLQINNQFLKQHKTTLKNKVNKKSTLFNKNISKKLKKISIKEITEIEKSDQKGSQNFASNQNTEIWNCIREMDQEKLKDFIIEIQKFYHKKFLDKDEIHIKEQDEVDDSQVTQKLPIVSQHNSNNRESNQIDKLRVELEEIKVMIKKMNN